MGGDDRDRGAVRVVERRQSARITSYNVCYTKLLRLVLGDRGIVLLRLVQLDTYLGDFFNETFWLSYSLLIGGGVSFGD